MKTLAYIAVIIAFGIGFYWCCGKAIKCSEESAQWHIDNPSPSYGVVKKGLEGKR